MQLLTDHELRQLTSDATTESVIRDAEQIILGKVCLKLLKKIKGLREEFNHWPEGSQERKDVGHALVEAITIFKMFEGREEDDATRKA